MTVYGGPRPTPPAPKLDPMLLGAFAFLVVALIVGAVFGVRAFTSDSPQSSNNAQQQTDLPAPETSSAAPPSSAPPSSAPSPTPSPTRPAALLQVKPSLLRASHSGLCMQTNEGNGANAVQQPCDANNPTELWVPQIVGNSQDTFLFVNAKDNRCLDVNGGSKDNGAPIVQWDCHSAPNQQWRLQRDGDGFRFVSVNSGRCIGVDSGNPNPGAAVRQWDCDNSANQRWQVTQ
ncbi:RICIN domain-containing protein [Dactylosporangium fulvum]|uniref:RICIN domain-containing protein n=1 Tax=Dactylosporangium fulvum TaxID=53359 RepID=A0ABY5VTT8_9ACTN|nr:RICIN domain-containing protein [Dactylosporangium fulvum]UWP80600.1 RICIN domain-containing protein [Dactylosporangium fulvum]